ncbi:hypothetical protein ZWY2020_021555 [Hordeum vulgare]|nr:hypothetical protein ZWY2020_021555 [Hordeum vulgare]
MAVEKIPEVNPPSCSVPGRGLLMLPISEALQRRNDGEFTILDMMEGFPIEGANSESMDAELRLAANGFDYKTFYRCEEGYEEAADNVIEAKCKHLLQKLRHEARPQAIRDYYAMHCIKKDKKLCRGRYLKKEQYMKANHNKMEVPHLYDLYVVAHTASYKKAKAFSKSDLDHPEKFTNISAHHKLVRYKDEGKKRIREEFNPSQEPFDQRMVMISGGGRPHGSIAIGWDDTLSSHSHGDQGALDKLLP